MQLIIISFFLIFSNAAAFGFKPEVMKQLWDLPSSEVRAATVKTYASKEVRIEEVYYESRPYRGKPVKIFGYFAYPVKRAGKLPAILLSHGGGGTASLARAAGWARRGYAVLAIDLPGKGENRARSRSGGPDMVVANLLRTQPELGDNYLVHAAAALRHSITYLTQRKEVDPERIGMVGLSWGGVLTLLTNGQDRRLKAAVNVFGAGYIPEGCTWEDWFNAMPAHDKELWSDYLDPKNFLAAQNAPILFITGTNDHCYYLPTFQKSYEEVGAQKNIYLIPNLRHRFLSSAQTPALAWLDQQLKTGGVFPEIKLFPLFVKNSKVIIPVKAAVSSRLTSLRLYYTPGGPQEWTEKSWLAISPYHEGGTYYFALPVARINPEVLFYVSAADNHGGAASTLVRSLFAVKLESGAHTFGLSSPIKKLYRHEKPVQLIGGQVDDSDYFYFSKEDGAYKIFRPLLK